jgi:hypothetical protein
VIALGVVADADVDAHVDGCGGVSRTAQHAGVAGLDEVSMARSCW